MKWVSVNNSSSSQHYELWDGEKKVVSLSISNQTKISRIECATDKRLFFIEKKGFLHSKTVINNEYGIRLGELIGENWEANEGMIELDGRKYWYTISDHDEAELVIYNESKSKALATCSLSSVCYEVAAVANKSKSLHDTKYPSLLMGLCWYLLKSKSVSLEIA
jgi:hypothetical protein